MACFIDTNIWLYAFVEGNEPGKSAIARTLISGSEPVVSTQVINEICVNLLQRANLPEEQIRLLVESFYDKYFVVDLGKHVASRHLLQPQPVLTREVLRTVSQSQSCPMITPSD